MKKNNFNEVSMNEVINALWLRLAADQLSRTASSGDSKKIAYLVDMRNELSANDRRRIPIYLAITMGIYGPKGLKRWLKDKEIFSEEEVGILCKDYRNIERARLSRTPSLPVVLDY